METAKITKDVTTLADIVLMTEIARHEKMIEHFQGNLKILTTERDKRVQEQLKKEAAASTDQKQADNAGL